jgi:hypothetical protein
VFVIRAPTLQPTFDATQARQIDAGRHFNRGQQSVEIEPVLVVLVQRSLLLYRPYRFHAQCLGEADQCVRGSQRRVIVLAIRCHRPRLTGDTPDKGGLKERSQQWNEGPVS